MRVRHPPKPQLSESKFLLIVARAEHQKRKSFIKSCELEVRVVGNISFNLEILGGDLL